jgi:hypothetical protein
MITSENYFSAENQMKYMGSSQFKAFMKCEAAALAMLRGEYAREVTDALLVGSYVDAHYEGTLDIFRAQHPEIFTRQGEPKAQYRHADEIIRRAERDELFSLYMSGEKQVIFTGEISGVPYKIKVDSYHPDKCIVDLKCVKDFEEIYDPETRTRQHFIDYWGYTAQGAIYREIVRQNTGKSLPFYIAAVTKEKEPDLRIYWIPDETLDEQLEAVKSLSPRFDKIKRGQLVPQRCEKCGFCKFTRKLTRAVNYKDEIICAD